MKEEKVPAIKRAELAGLHVKAMKRRQGPQMPRDELVFAKAQTRDKSNRFNMATKTFAKVKRSRRNGLWLV